MLSWDCGGGVEREVGSEFKSTMTAVIIPVRGFIGGMRYEKEEEQSYCDVDDDREFAHLIGRRRCEGSNQFHRIGDLNLSYWIWDLGFGSCEEMDDLIIQ